MFVKEPGVPEMSLSSQLFLLPDQALGLRIIAAFKRRGSVWTYEGYSFPTSVIRMVWQDHVNSNFPWEIGETLFHGRYLRAPYFLGGNLWFTGRDAMLRRWLECFNAMLTQIHSTSKPGLKRGWFS
jgi:hypothetical protein